MSSLRRSIVVSALLLFGCRNGEGQPTEATTLAPKAAASTQHAGVAVSVREPTANPNPPMAPPSGSFVAPPSRLSASTSGAASALGSASPLGSAVAFGAGSGSSTPAGSAASTTQAEIARLKRCCVQFERLSQKNGQEGVGLAGLSSTCDEMVSALEDGHRPSLNASDWDEIRDLLGEKSVPPACRTLMLSFEKR